jgi:hypothetical protein
MRSGESVLPQIPFFQQMFLAPVGTRNYVEACRQVVEIPPFWGGVGRKSQSARLARGGYEEEGRT